VLELATKFKPDADEPFQAAVDAGLLAAELWTGPAVLDRRAEVVERARRFPLRYALHFPTRRDLTERQLDEAVELYRALGCRSMTIHQLEFDRYAPDLLRRDPALTLAVENSHLAPPQLAAWAENNRYLTLDAEHVWYLTHPEKSLGEVLAVFRDLLERYAAKLRHVHLPGYWLGQDEHRPMYCSREFVFPVLSLLDEFGFDGLVVSESDVQYQTPNDLRMDALLFDTWKKQRR
jgi:sugar phosphate isomerase/epimerase